VYEPPPPAPGPQPVANPNRGLGMMIGGFASFSGIYLINVVIAASSVPGSDAKWLYIPVAGPFAVVSQLRFVERNPDLIVDGSGLSNTVVAIAGVFLVIDGLAQVTTLSLGIAGATIFGKSRSDARLAIAPGGLRYKF
jgi:hypothetical protein